MILGSLFALFAIFTSFVGFGLSTRDALIDFLENKIRKNLAIFLVVIPPLAFSLFYPNSFFDALEFAGFYGDAIFMGVLPLLIVLRSRKMGERIPGFVTPGGKIIPVIVFLFFVYAVLYKTFSYF